MQMEAVAAKLLEHCLSLPSSQCRNLPSRPAIYILYVPPDILLYIGKTESLRTRGRYHLGSLGKIAGIHVAWFPLPVQFHTSVERQLIETYRPILNSKHVPEGSIHFHVGRTREIKKFIKQRLSPKPAQPANGNGHK